MDGQGEPTESLDGQIERDRFGSRRGDDRDGIAGFDAEGAEPEGQVADSCGEVGPCRLLP
jgi:hypothetical protein